jgi:hypothetical protein
MDYLHLDIDHVMKDTGKAFLVHVVDGRELWLPKKVISDPEDYKEGDMGEITISIQQWFADKEGIEPVEYE